MVDFFDKATTITRIVGFHKVLELIIHNIIERDKIWGWENALSEFRDLQRKGELIIPKNIDSIIILKNKINTNDFKDYLENHLK